VIKVRLDEISLDEDIYPRRPLTTQVKSHHDVEYAKKNRIMLNINRDLIVYRK
jgi:hypothetical protein